MIPDELAYWRTLVDDLRATLVEERRAADGILDQLIASYQRERDCQRLADGWLLRLGAQERTIAELRAKLNARKAAAA